MAAATQRFVLVGPHAGKTMPVNGHEFVDGEYEFQGSPEQVITLTKIFGLYGALPADQAELEALRAQVAAKSEPEASAPAVPEATGTTLAEAIGTLDPENDAHWTSNNLPALDPLAEMIGKRVTRDEVNAVADGYTRAKAKAARQ